MKLQFGDIIGFEAQNFLGFHFRHFGIYVGDIDICGKKAEKVLYHQNKYYPGYRFSKLKSEYKFEVMNFLDDYTDPLNGKTYCKGDDKDILKRIIETYHKREIYGVLHNNCEHLATYLRYGVKVSLQLNMHGERLVINSKKLDTKYLRKYLKDRSECPLHLSGISEDLCHSKQMLLEKV